MVVLLRLLGQKIGVLAIYQHAYFQIDCSSIYDHRRLGKWFHGERHSAGPLHLPQPQAGKYLLPAGVDRRVWDRDAEDPAGLFAERQEATDRDLRQCLQDHPAQFAWHADAAPENDIEDLIMQYVAGHKAITRRTAQEEPALVKRRRAGF